MINRYGVFGSVRLLISLIYTKLAFPKARLIRLPFDIRNRRNIHIGNNFTSGFGCRIEAFPKVKTNEKILILGDNIEVNDYVHIAAGEQITIGNNVLLASKIFISDINHGAYSDEDQDSPLIPPNKRRISTSPVIIEDDVWIGESVCVLPGVTIGKGSIIGSLSVVSKSIPPFSIAVGSPARVIKQFDFESGNWVKIK